MAVPLQTPWVGERAGCADPVAEVAWCAGGSVELDDVGRLYCSLPQLDGRLSGVLGAPGSWVSLPPSLDSYFWGKYGPKPP